MHTPNDDPRVSGSQAAREPDEVARPRWLGAVIVLLCVTITLGVLHVGWRLVWPREAAPAASADPLERGRALVRASDCMRCHLTERKAVGPGFVQIAERYRGDPEAVQRMAERIRRGSVGVWGRVLMPPHPALSEADALLMARWVLSTAPAVSDRP